MSSEASLDQTGSADCNDNAMSNAILLRICCAALFCARRKGLRLVVASPFLVRGCESRDSNPDGCYPLDPKSSASANSATLANLGTAKS